MNPEQAWQASLAQLQMEMPKATFDTWVRDARFLSFEDGNFTVGVANAYICEWLESRLTSTINRILAGILNQQTDVHFVVISPTTCDIHASNQIISHPETAWGAVFSHVEMRLHTTPAGKANFDRYLRGADFLGFDHTTFTIGLSTIEARDWVETTMNCTLKSMLTDLMRRPVEVRFVVAPTQGEELSSAQDGTDEGEISVARVSNDEAEILIKPICTSLYETITRPKSVVVVPAYVLRWLPYLGPDKGWFLIAMRQTFYQVYGKRISLANCGQTFTVNRKRLARWAGMGERLVRRFMKELENSNQDGNFLAWFMQCFKGRPGKPNIYAFRADIPLTPADAEALSTWLIENGIQENPMATLQRALEMQPRELLCYPAPPLTEHHRTMKPNPCTVQEVVFAAAGIPKTNPHYLPLKKLTDELQQHLQSPADNLVLTHYFLLEWLPKLGHTAAWVIAILRDRGFIDHNTGIRRDRIKLEGGYSELAQLLNVNERQIRDWLPALESMKRRGTQSTGETGMNSYWEKRQAKRKLVGSFLGKSGAVGWHGHHETTYEFKVKLEDPLTPEHQEIYEALGQLLYDCMIAGDASKLEWLATELDKLVRERSNPAESWYADDPGQQEVGTHMIQPSTDLIRGRSSPESADDPGQSTIGTRAIQLKALLIKHLYPKALADIKHLLQQHLTEFHEDRNESEAEGGVENDHRVWNWEKLLGYGGIPGEIRAEILHQPEIQKQFLGQALYGFEHQAYAEGRGIKSPFKYAEKHRHTCPLPEYMELASLSPGKLALAIKDWQGKGSGYGLSDSAFRVVKALRANEFLRIIADATIEMIEHRRIQETLKKGD